MNNLDYTDYLNTLNKISRAIVSDLYLEDILKLIVTLTANVMKAKVCNVWLIDEKKQEFNIKATQSMHQEYLNKRTIKLNEGIVGLVAREKKPKLIFDVLKEEQYIEKKLARREGLVSMASIPMMVKDKVIGVLNVYTNKPYEFTKADISLLSSVKASLSAAFMTLLI